MAQIAKEAGVSVATVSRALGPESVKLNEKTVKRINEVAQALGYQVNIAAQTLSLGRAPLVGVIVPHLQTSHFPTLISHASQILSPAGFEVVAKEFGQNQGEEVIQALDIMQRFDAAGVILCPDGHAQQDRHLFQALNRYKMPIVIVDRPLPLPGIPNVLPENREGGRKGAQWLIENGCDRVLFAQPIRSSVCPDLWVERYHGFRDAAQEAGIEFSCWQRGDDDDASRNEAVNLFKWVFEGKKAGIFINTLYRLDRLFSTLDEANVEMPRQTLLTGFDWGRIDLRQGKVIRTLASLESWPLTITYSGEEMGNEAAELLLNRLESGSWGSMKIDIPTTANVELPGLSELHFPE
jgi:DNA-binding LacI/PurR family transcriptional regulator